MANLDFYGNSYGWLKNILESSHDAILGLDLNAKILKCNKGVNEIYGYNADEIVGKSIYNFIPEEYHNDLKLNFDKAKNGEVVAHYEGTRFSKDNSKKYISASLAPIKNDNDIVGVVAVAKDFTHIKNIESKLLEQNLQLNLIKKIFDNAHEGMIITNQKTEIQVINSSFENLTGYKKNELIGKPTSILKSGKHSEFFYKKFYDDINKYNKWAGELWSKTKSGELNLSWVTISTVKNEITNENMYVAVFNDLTERMEYENKLKYQALHDTLTGLPNRLMYQDKLTKELDKAEKNKKMLCVCFLDLDGFKNVNDSLGHDIGDILLKMVSKRLQNAISRVDFVARLGGDEFTIIIYDFKDKKNLDKIAKRIIKNIGKAYSIRKNVIKISVSLGLSMYPDNSNSSIELMKQADTAMYKAKNSGKNRYVFFNYSLKY